MKHFLEIRTMEIEQIQAVLARAQYYQQHEENVATVLKGKFVANLFFEPSTRTRFSFEVAERRLGAEVLNFTEASSSRTKGETIYDTIRTLEAMGVDAAVIRLTDNQLLNEFQHQLNVSLINAGAGDREHPTQALLDVLTMQEHFGSVAGLTVGIVGDIAHSRVAGSHMHLLPRLGAKLLFAGADGMVERTEDPIPEGIECVTVDEIVAQADVVIMLRVQHERHAQHMHMTVEDYHQQYGLTKARAAQMKRNAVIMHPAPVNRGVEINSELVESEQSLILRQVTNGVYVRMAVLDTLLGGNNG